MLVFVGTLFGTSARVRIELEPERPLHPEDEQLRAELPELDEMRVDPDRLTCGECAHFKRGPGDFRPCVLRRLQTRAREMACAEFDARI